MCCPCKTITKKINVVEADRYLLCTTHLRDKRQCAQTDALYYILLKVILPRIVP